jgi:hypothetical protein
MIVITMFSIYFHISTYFYIFPYISIYLYHHYQHVHPPFPGMYHTCAICAPLAEVLAPVTSAFESGIGAALKSLGVDVRVLGS